MSKTATLPAITAFDKVKSDLAGPIKLWDIQANNEMFLVVDASAIGIGEVLQQKYDSLWWPISLYSRKLPGTETLIWKGIGTSATGKSAVSLANWSQNSIRCLAVFFLTLQRKFITTYNSHLIFDMSSVQISSLQILYYVESIKMSI